MLRATPRYTFIQGWYWAYYCVIITFSSVYLLSRGFSNTSIGLLISISGILSSLLQPLISHCADNLKRFSLRQFSSILLLVQAVAVLLLIPASGKLPQMLVYGFLVIFLQVVLPLVNALGMDCVNRNIPLNFGVARGAGSISYGVVSSLCGILVLHLGERSLPAAALLLALLLLLSVFTFRFPNEAPSCQYREEETVAKAEKKGFLLRYSRIIPALLGVVLMLVSHNILNTYAFQIILPLGGTSAQMGTQLLIQSLAELPIMFGFFFLLRHFRASLMFRLSGIGFFLHALGTLIAPSVGVLYAVQIFELPGYALFTLSYVYWVNDAVRSEDRVQGQAYFTTAMTLGSVIASFAGGIILDHLCQTSAMPLLAVSTAAGLGGMLLLFLTPEKLTTDVK